MSEIIQERQWITPAGNVETVRQCQLPAGWTIQIKYCGGDEFHDFDVRSNECSSNDLFDLLCASRADERDWTEISPLHKLAMAADDE